MSDKTVTAEAIIQEYRKLQQIRKRPDVLDWIPFSKMKQELHYEQYGIIQRMVIDACYHQPQLIAKLLSVDSPLDEREQGDILSLARGGSVSLKDNQHLVKVFALLRQMDTSTEMRMNLEWYQEAHGY